MSTSINLLILDRFKQVERMMRVAAAPYADALTDSGSGDQPGNDRRTSENGKICPMTGVLKRDTVLPFLFCSKGGMKQKEIAEEIRVSPSTLSEMINRLVEDGYVERKADAGDRRVKTLFLTEAGRARAEFMLSQITLVLDSLFINLDDTEKQQLICLLDKLVGNNAAVTDEGDIL